MPAAQLRPPHPLRVVFDGQSLNNPQGDQPAEVAYPAQLMATLPGVPWRTVALDGVSWTLLATTAPARLFSQAVAATSVLVLMGGTSDIYFEGDSGLKVYQDMRDYAVRARAAGFDKIIGTTITPATWFDDFPNTMPARRVAANAAILADADHAFDAVADVAAGPTLSVKSSPAFTDGVHYSVAGAAEAAGIVRPVLVPFL